MRAIADVIILAFSGSLLTGAVTFYPASRFEGQPLYCSQHLGEMTYSQETAEQWGPWVALDVGMYESGRVQCGDKFMLWLEGQRPFEVMALDAGTFTAYHIDEWPELAIVADVPEYWLDSSKRGLLIGH